jgi:hypothetical protein
MGYFDDLLKTSAKSYNSYTNEFNNYNGGVASSSTSSSSSKVMNMHSQAINDAHLARQKRYAHRSLLDRGLDTLMIGLYPTAGFVKGMVDGGSDNDVSPLEGFVGGLKASNPFGDGYEKGEYTYSRVFESAGWKPESTLGKVAKGTVGFALDVLLDPTTYLTGGATALIKGTGRIGMLGKSIKELTPDMAKQVIEETTKSRNLKSLSSDELEEGAKQLSQKYNELMGVDRKGNGLTLSLGNAPFGDKIFGKYADKSIKLMDDMPLRKIGDNTIAPLYATTRDALYGSKIGELFSTKSPLYNLAKTKPEAVYDMMKMVDYTQGLNLDKLNAEKVIRDNAKKYMNLTPAEEKELLDVLQDKTIWHEIKKTLKVADTHEGKSFRQWLNTRKENKTAEVAELRKVQNSIEDLMHNRSNELGATRKSLDELQAEFDEKIANFDPRNADVKQLEEVNAMLRKQVKQLNDDISSITPKEITHQSIVKKFDENKIANKQDVIDDLNKYLFNGDKVISRAIYPDDLKDIVDMARKGDDKSIIGAYIQSNPKFTNDRAQTINSYLAKVFGYGTGEKHSSWDSYFSDRIQEIQKLKKAGKADRGDLMLEHQLLKEGEQHAKLKKRLESAKSAEQVKKLIERDMEVRLFDEVKGTEGLWNTTGRGKFREDGGEVRDKFLDEDSAIHETSKQFEGSKQNDWVDRTMKEGNKNPIEITYSDMMSARHGFAKYMDWDAENLNKLSATKKTMLSSVEKEIPALLEGFFRKNIDELSSKQEKFLYALALQNAQKNNPDWFRSIKKIDDELQKKVDKAKALAESEKKKKEMLDKIKKGIKEEQGKRKAFESTVKQRDELIEQIKKNTAKIKDIGENSKNSLIKEYEERLGSLKSKVDDLEQEYKILDDALDSGDIKRADKLEEQIANIEEALVDDEVLDNLMRMKYGKDHVDDVIKRATDESTGEIFINAKRTMSEKVVDMAKVLRKEFQDIGDAEVEIGKLSRDQVDEMMWEYVTRIASPEFVKFASTKKGQDITKKTPGLTKDLGYGNKYNPYSKSRTKFKIMLNDEWITNPTIHQLNEYFKPYLNGKNAFSESVADIYVTRAKKHTELMYDNQYMNEMMNVFGKELKVGSKADKGYKAVMNFGQMKKMVVDHARMLMGDAIAKGNRAVFYEHFENALKDFGITPNMLDELKTPMVELSEAQIKSIQKIIPTAPIRQVNDAIVLRANQARKLQMAKDQSRFFQIYDKMTHLLKLNMTTVVPSFHIRNEFSNQFQSWLAVGRDALNYKFKLQALKAIKNRGSREMKDRFNITMPDGTVKSMEWNEAYELAKVRGVIDEGFFAKDIGAEAMTTGVLPKVPAKFDPTDSENFLLYRKGAEIGGYTENTSRFTHFVAMLRQGKTADEASESVNKFLFDYSDLTTFEKTIMKRIFPFYTWLRKNARLQLSQMLEQPEKYRHVGKILQGIEGMNNEEDRMDSRYISNFAQDWVQTPFSKTNEQGREEPILWNPNLPFGDMSRIPDPFNPLDSAKELFSQFNPLIKVPVEQATNHHTFFDRPLVKEGDSQVLKRGEHVLQQLALYNAGAGVIKKESTDSALHALSNLTGIKFLSYDDKAYKYMQQEKMLENK